MQTTKFTWEVVVCDPKRNSVAFITHDVMVNRSLPPYLMMVQPSWCRLVIGWAPETPGPAD